MDDLRGFPIIFGNTHLENFQFSKRHPVPNISSGNLPGVSEPPGQSQIAGNSTTPYLADCVGRGLMGCAVVVFLFFLRLRPKMPVLFFSLKVTIGRNFYQIWIWIWISSFLRKKGCLPTGWLSKTSSKTFLLKRINQTLKF